MINEIKDKLMDAERARTLPPKWCEMLEHLAETFSKSNHGTLLFLCSGSERLHTDGALRTTKQWDAPAKNLYSLIKSDIERTRLVTYIRTRTAHGSIFFENARCGFDVGFSDRLSARGVSGWERLTTGIRLFVHDRDHPSGFEVPRGFPYIHTITPKPDETEPTSGSLSKAGSSWEGYGDSTLLKEIRHFSRFGPDTFPLSNSKARLLPTQTCSTLLPASACLHRK